VKARTPRITLVTACLNDAATLDETIRSVLEQDYPDLEYLIVDGGSHDGTQDVIRRYETRLSHWVSEPDRGHAHALNKGFARATGAVMGWLNADDVLHRGALRLLADVFGAFEDVEWLTAQPSHLSPDGAAVATYPPRRWSRLAFLTGEHRYIQQESTFWRRSLWERSGARLDERYRLACDFELWARLFRHARLHSTWGMVGAFRFRPDQRSRTKRDEYDDEVRSIVSAELQLLLEQGVPGPDDALWAPAPPLLAFDWLTLSYTREGSVLPDHDGPLGKA
jgi:glycosyltransferase involved in cell wall biosynthesis